jgi:hypothetical protein
MAEAKELRIYDFLNAIHNKSNLPYDKSIAPAYMLCIWLSHDLKLLNIVNEITPYLGVLPDEAIYNYFYDAIPRGKRFIKWIPKEKIDKEVEEAIKELMELKNISWIEASQYIRKV